MTRPWIHGEHGPICFCGNPTVVVNWEQEPFNGWIMFCLAHTVEASAWFRLYPEAPDDFENVVMQSTSTLGQLKAYVENKEISREEASKRWLDYIMDTSKYIREKVVINVVEDTPDPGST